jgi:acetyl-CoA carboxylase carboxyltransferase component
MATLKEKNQRIQSLKDDAHHMGGEEEIAKQLKAGKLTVRQRLDLLLDRGSLFELGILAQSVSGDLALKDKRTPADGVITGFGLIGGRRVAIIAYDFTVIAGSIGEVNERKCDRMRELALTERVPIVWLLDSAGARIQEIASSRFAETGKLFYDQVKMSGVVPQVAAVMGPCAAGTAYIAGLADFVPMVKGTASMALAGAHLVKAAIGEEISTEDLGGSRVHCVESGVADLEAVSDEACLAAIKKYLSYMPSHCDESPARAEWDEDRLRLPDDLLTLIPESSKRPYDMKAVIKLIGDYEDFFEIKPQFAPGIITALTRIGGFAVGVVANQPMVAGGVIDVDGSDKAARFINLCNAYNIPLVFLQDVPGFMVGSAVEKKGIIRHGAKMLFATSRASVPKVTVVLRKAYGAGYYVMCGRAFGPDAIYAWPSAEISLMGAEGAVNIVHRKDIQTATDPVAKKAELIGLYEEKISLEMAYQGATIDDVIDPRDTRKLIIKSLENTRAKRQVWPARKQFVDPV